MPYTAKIPGITRMRRAINRDILKNPFSIDYFILKYNKEKNTFEYEKLEENGSSID